jgi:excisionase family DNA binding protein
LGYFALKKQIAASPVQPRLLNVRQAAEYLACNVHAIRQLQWSRAIPFLKIGKFIQFDKQDLDAFVAAQKTASARE